MKIVQTKYGRGVSADKNYKKGDVLAISEGIPLSENQMPSESAGSPIWAYIFNGLYPGLYILALDWTSLMNHSDDPNVDYFPISLTQVKFIALKDINEGDELNIDYGYDVANHSKHFGIDEDKLVNDTQLFDSMTNMAPSSGGVDVVKLYSVGKCPESGCIEQDSEGNWRIISNKTGEYWKQKYHSEENARKALEAYHAHKVANFDKMDKYLVYKGTDGINRIAKNKGNLTVGSTIEVDKKVPLVGTKHHLCAVKFIGTKDECLKYIHGDRITMFDALSEIKKQLFDASPDIMESFNIITFFFDVKSEAQIKSLTTRLEEIDKSIDALKVRKGDVKQNLDKLHLQKRIIKSQINRIQELSK